jgi:hypothetical protein
VLCTLNAMNVGSFYYTIKISVFIYKQRHEHDDIQQYLEHTSNIKLN